MIVADATLAGLFDSAAPGGSAFTQLIRRAEERDRVANLTPAKRAAEQSEAQKAATVIAALRKTKPAGGYLVATDTLNETERELQAATLARNYDRLFAVAGPRFWPPNAPLGKYSFREVNGQRIFVPFTQADLRKFMFSPYMKVQPGYQCTDTQKTAMVAHYLKASRTHMAKFPPTRWEHIFPIYPGTNLCWPKKKSTWDKLKPIAIVATVVVGGILIGKAVVAKAASASAAKAGAVGAKAGLVGGGAKAGAATALTTKAGVGAALSTGTGTAAAAAAAAGGVVTNATTAGGIIGAAAKAVPVAEGIINGARTVKAIADGELPPPPISLGDGSLTDYASLVGQQLAERELGRTLSEAEAAMLAQMIERERRFLAASETAHPPAVNVRLNPALAAAQQTRADAALSEGNLVKVLAIGIPAAVLLAKGI